MNNDQPLDITDFLKLILETLEASGVEYLIGGAIAEWAWGEPRATQDLDNVGLTQNKNSNTIYDALEGHSSIYRGSLRKLCPSCVSPIML